jgi:hypothetical protein
VQTNADGHFVRDFIFGDYGHAWVGFFRTDYSDPGLIFTIAPGDHLSNVMIRLPRAKPMNGTVTGRVIDENGRGKANVEVAIYRSGPVNRMLDHQNSTRTDDRGEFRLFGLKPDRYIVGFSAGFLPGSSQASIPPVLYPGVGQVSRAEVVTVENDKESVLRKWS